MSSSKDVVQNDGLSDFDAARKLVELLAARLQEIVPSEFIVEADEGRLHVAKYGHLSTMVDVGWVMEDENQTFQEKVAVSAYSALNTVQDFVAEHTGLPWPPSGRSSSSALPLPRSSWNDNQLELGYGEDASLKLTPISMVELQSK